MYSLSGNLSTIIPLIQGTCLIWIISLDYPAQLLQDLSNIKIYYEFHNNETVYKRSYYSKLRKPCEIYLFLNLDWNQTSLAIHKSQVAFNNYISFILVPSLYASEKIRKVLQEGLEQHKDFPRIFVPLILLVNDITFIYCYFCLETSKLIAINSDSTTENWDKMHAKLNINNGRGKQSVLNVPIWFRRRSCSVESIHVIYECSHVEMLSVIFHKKMNLSLEFEVEPEPYDIDEELSTLHISMEDVSQSPEEIEDFIKIQGEHFIMRTHRGSFVYCKNQTFFLRPDMGIFLKPFDKYVWMLMILTLISYTAYYRDFTIALQVIALALSQTIQKRLKKLMALLAILLIVITEGYDSVITSFSIATPVERGFKSLEELIKNGYRFLVPSDNHFEFLSSFLPQVESQFGMKMKIGREHFFVSTEYENNKKSQYKVMVKHKAYIEFPIDGAIANKFKFTDGQFTFGYYRCHVLPLSFSAKIVFALRLYFAKQARWTLDILRQGGFFCFWIVAEGFSKFEANKDLQRNVNRFKHLSRSLPLDSHIRIMFYTGSAGLMIGFLSFVIEILLNYNFMIRWMYLCEYVRCKLKKLIDWRINRKNKSKPFQRRRQRRQNMYPVE